MLAEKLKRSVSVLSREGSEASVEEITRLEKALKRRLSKHGKNEAPPKVVS